MAAEEPFTKKSRMSEEPSEIPEEMEAFERSITFNLSEYPHWVRSLSDEELEKIFQIGVMVKESIEMTVTSNQKHLKEVLASQLASEMTPIQDKVVDIKTTVDREVLKIQQEVTKIVSENITNMTTAVGKLKQDVRDNLTEIGEKFTSKVNDVASKVQPLSSLKQDIATSKERVLDEVRKVNKSVEGLEKPKTKGSIGERTVLNILKDGLPRGFTVEDVSKRGNTGDVLVTTAEGEEFVIEVKNHQYPVQKKEIENFEKVLANSTTARVGIMFSLKSGISNRSKRGGKFEICPFHGKYLIFVPNALEEENLITWSVMLANEVAQLNAELKDNQRSMLQDLYQSFNVNIENARNSRRNIQTLEATVESLKENIVPILDIIEKYNREMNKILH